MTRRHLAIGLGLTVAMVWSGATTASAAEPEVHPDVAYALQAEPGGVALDYLTAVWPETGMRLDVDGGTSAAAGTARRAMGSCATGSICAFSLGGQTGTKLTWPTCGAKSTAALSSVGSIANARTSGILHALQGSTTRASAAAGAYANVPISYRTLITNVSC